MLPPLLANASSAVNTSVAPPPPAAPRPPRPPRPPPPSTPSGKMMASNRSFGAPAARSFSVMVVNGTLYVSRIQCVQPASIGSDALGRKSAIRFVDLPLSEDVYVGSGISLIAPPVVG